MEQKSFDTSRVLLIDDSPALRELMRNIIELSRITVVGEASTATEAIQKAKELEPDVLVFGLRMSSSGLDAVEMLIRELPNIPVLIVSAERSRRVFERARGSGIRGYLLASEILWSLAFAVRKVLGGFTYFSPDEFFYD